MGILWHSSVSSHLLNVEDLVSKYASENGKIEAEKREKPRGARGSGKATECMVGANSLGREPSSTNLQDRKVLFGAGIAANIGEHLLPRSIIFFQRFLVQKVNRFGNSSIFTDDLESG